MSNSLSLVGRSAGSRAIEAAAFKKSTQILTLWEFSLLTKELRIGQDVWSGTPLRSAFACVVVPPDRLIHWTPEEYHNNDE